MSSLLAATLVAPVVTAAPAEATTTVVTLRITSAIFTGKAWLRRTSTGRPLEILAQSTSCNVAGVRSSASVVTPFVTSLCEFKFTTSAAAISTKCTGLVIHPSSLTYYIPFTGESVVVGYDTTTDVDQGSGTGVGINRTGLGHVHFVFESLCDLTEEQAEAEGNLVGYATAT